MEQFLKDLQARIEQYNDGLVTPREMLVGMVDRCVQELEKLGPEVPEAEPTSPGGLSAS